ncbi:hypothetical protein ACQPW3_13425 [Actinosynnema sp. CA-248983]
MRIRLLSRVGGRPVGDVFDHDEAGATALIAARVAELVHEDERQAAEPAAPEPAPQEAAVTPKRARAPRRG